MSKSAWLLIFCVLSNKIITAVSSAIPQLPVLPDGVSETTASCSIDSNCQEPEPTLQDATELIRPETKITTKNPSASINKEIVENPIEKPTDAETKTRKEQNIELEAIEFSYADIKGTKDDEISTTYIKDNEDIKDKASPKTELSSQQYSKNNEILSKIETALTKSKEMKNQQSIIAAPDMVPIFRPKCKNVVSSNKNQNTMQIVKKCTTECKSTEQNPSCVLNQEEISQSKSNFSITGVYLKPLIGNEGSFKLSTNTPNIKSLNIAPLTKETDLRSIIDASITSDVSVMPSVTSLEQRSKSVQVNNVPCAVSKPNNAVMVLYKPEIISLEQFYGEFMKKLTITVLVPYYISKLTSIQNYR